MSEWNLDYNGQNRCEVCAKKADLRCKMCKSVYYCGKECQTHDWSVECHNQDCISLKDDLIGGNEGGCAIQPGLSGLVSKSRLTMGKFLGKGAFGQVIAGTFDGRPVAIKTIQQQPDPQKQAAAINEFREEANLLAKIPPHPNVVQFIGITQNPLMLITELVNGGSLDSRLKPGKPVVGWDDILRWCTGIVSGIQHLHNNNIFHRDLATRNVLIDQNNNAKVTDFGLSVRVCSGQGPDLSFQQKTFFRGPYKWMAPESLQYNVFSKKSDVWAFGVTMWEIMSRRPDPFEFRDINYVKAAVLDPNVRLRLPLPSRWPTSLKDIMSSCWRTQAKDRPSTRRILFWLGLVNPKLLGNQLPAISDQEIRQLYGTK